VRIDPKHTISGIPILTLRGIFKEIHANHCGIFGSNLDYVRNDLKLSSLQIKNLFDALIQLEYVYLDNRSEYHLTKLGSRFALSSAAVPLKRKTADRKLSELLTRCKKLNENDMFCYKINRVILYGSYLTNKERISDVDIAMEIEQREKDIDKRKIAKQAAIDRAHTQGKSFTSFISRLFYPYDEVYYFLKSRCRTVSIHLYESKSDLDTFLTVLVEDGGTIKEIIV
jgi:hypothetical protein